MILLHLDYSYHYIHLNSYFVLQYYLEELEQIGKLGEEFLVPIPHHLASFELHMFYLNHKHLLIEVIYLLQ